MNNGSETTEIPEIKLYNECDFNNVAIDIENQLLKKIKHNK